MLVGLTAKNAILIVEFAKDRHEAGRPIVEAALEGARLRLRPILMTSFAFIFGCVPLWTATGAGAAARRMLGTAVVSGMLAATLLGVFIIPALFVFVERLACPQGDRRRCARRRPVRIRPRGARGGRQSGARGVSDCQPPDCPRDPRVLVCPGSRRKKERVEA